MIESVQQGNIIILTIKEPELNDSEPLVNSIQTALENNNTFILVDLGFVTHISSIVLGTLVTTFKNIKSQQGELKFLNVQPSVANIFNMTRLNRIFEIFNDKETALKSFPINA